MEPSYFGNMYQPCTQIAPPVATNVTLSADYQDFYLIPLEDSSKSSVPLVELTGTQGGQRCKAVCTRDASTSARQQHGNASPERVSRIPLRFPDGSYVSLPLVKGTGQKQAGKKSDWVTFRITCRIQHGQYMVTESSLCPQSQDVCLCICSH